MPRMSFRPLIVMTPLALALAACGGSGGSAEGEAPAELKIRHDNFEAISDSFKMIRAQFEEGKTPDIVMVAAAARDINERANAIKDHFPEGSGRDAGWDTEALPTIWETPADFAAAQQKLLEESATMMTLAEADDVEGARAQVGPLGAACKNCHDTFRLDDD